MAAPGGWSGARSPLSTKVTLVSKPTCRLLGPLLLPSRVDVAVEESFPAAAGLSGSCSPAVAPACSAAPASASSEVVARLARSREPLRMPTNRLSLPGSVVSVVSLSEGPASTEKAVTVGPRPLGPGDSDRAGGSLPPPSMPDAPATAESAAADARRRWIPDVATCRLTTGGRSAALARRSRVNHLCHAGHVRVHHHRRVRSTAATCGRTDRIPVVVSSSSLQQRASLAARKSSN